VPGVGRLQRIAALTALIRQRGRLTRVEAARELQISPMTATVYLRELCQRGVARKVMPNPAPRSHYFISALIHE
jgi:DeoR/GlpR family transcriptional regulator of sugar metabolism